MRWARVSQGVLAGRFGRPLLATGSRVLYQDKVRKMLMPVAGRWIRSQLERGGDRPANRRRIERQRWLLFLSILESVNRCMERRIVSPQVMRLVTALWARALLVPSERRPAVRRFRQDYGCDPPWLLTIGPGHACNLRCDGCYANASDTDAKLEWSLLDLLIAQAKQLWDIKLVVFSGGEPLLYESEGKGVIDIVERNPDLLFLMFTNGTLLTREVAMQLGRFGNLTAAFSVEGLRDTTDRHRGAGVFDDVLESIGFMREAGVPFGISVAVNRNNIGEALSREFLEFFFRDQGAFYCFFFQYMPVGRTPDFDLMPTPAQRVEFLRRTWDAVERERHFIIDFWNHGPLVKGCISAGRGGGYIYIDWNGKVMPCVFAPYSVGNVHDVYRKGGSLNDLWGMPFFQAIRDWQDGYGYSGGEPVREANWLRPCPFRDHHAVFRRWIQEHRPDPEDEEAGVSFMDEEYERRLVAYGHELAELTMEIWEKEYVGGVEGAGP